MGSWNDFNDAQSNTNLIPKGTLAKVRLTIRPGGFDDASQGWTGGYAKGNADKAAMIAAARARGFSPADDNEADAIAILFWALETKGGLQ